MTALETRAPAATQLDADVLIIGAGFGGLGMAIRLKRSRKASFLVLERGAELGGTWRDNIYPGCACDIPAMLYSFSFTRNADWSRIYPQQPEILAYLKRTARKEGILGRVRFNSTVAEARFDAAANVWTTTLTDGTRLHSRIIVSAMGPLNKPKFPDIPGRDDFAGPSFHSSQWNYDVDLHGKRVAVIGTGASAVQFIPQIAPQAAQLSVFQRTPPWVIPRGDMPVSSGRRTARRHVPWYAALVRKAIYWILELRALGFVMFPQVLARRERDFLRFLEFCVPDEELRAKLTPTYRAGCKRILISDDFYPALQRPNVELLTEPIARIGRNEIVTGSGRRIPADVIIYGTGFNATSGIAPVRVFGVNGAELGQIWRDGMQAYLGTTVAGFPNLFMVIGPNTGLGHNSMIFMMEAQYRYILKAIAYVKRKKRRAVDVKAEVMRQFNAGVQRRMRGTVWASGCSSWYQDANGTNVSLWPGFTFVYRSLTARFNSKHYVTTDASANAISAP